MSRLIPSLDPVEIKNSGERKLAQELVRQLPQRVEIYHSFNWLDRDPCGVLQEGECDFVLLDPQAGLLFIEVKGGLLEFDVGRTLWIRTGYNGEQTLLGRDPLKQVQGNMHRILGLIRKQFKSSEQLPFTYGYAVAFPDGRFSGPVPPGLEAELILDADCLQRIDRQIERIFKSFQRYPHPELTIQQLQLIRSALLPEYRVHSVLWKRIERQEEQLKRLTEDQEMVLGMLARHRRAAICGVAGSGKTLLALAKAQELAGKGLRTLFLCFNRMLKEWIEEIGSEHCKENLTVETYHGLITKLCEETDLPFSTENMAGNREFWNEQAPEFLIQACERLPDERKFDALVVDEGQDFRELWWASLEDIFRCPADKGAYYVFYDPHQALFVEDTAIPAELGEPFCLPVNCRNTVSIAGHCADIVKQEIPVKSSSPEGDKPRLIRKKNLKEAFTEAGKQVRLWCMPKEGGLKTSQAAVLAPSYTESCWPQDFQTVPLTRSLDDWRGDRGVLLTTWGRFKGLEADAVCIIEGQGSGKSREAANRYVAHSRAKHLLTVIEVEDE